MTSISQRRKNNKLKDLLYRDVNIQSKQVNKLSISATFNLIKKPDKLRFFYEIKLKLHENLTPFLCHKVIHRHGHLF